MSARMTLRFAMTVTVSVLAMRAAAANASGSTTIPPAPVAPIEPVVDDYYGTKVTDDYRWMESRSPRFVAWMKGENAHARAVLEHVPGRQALFERIHAHTGGGTLVGAVQLAGGRVFYEKRGPTDNSFKLYVRETLSGPERLLVDPDRLASGSGPHYAIDYYQTSHDGRRIAYGVSAGGSENSVIHVLDLATGTHARETIDQIGRASCRERV